MRRSASSGARPAHRVTSAAPSAPVDTTSDSCLPHPLVYSRGCGERRVRQQHVRGGRRCTLLPAARGVPRRQATPGQSPVNAGQSPPHRVERRLARVHVHPAGEVL
jgi:hypothetical protein